jgi:hypothetical protein
VVVVVATSLTFSTSSGPSAVSIVEQVASGMPET